MLSWGYVCTLVRVPLSLCTYINGGLSRECFSFIGREIKTGSSSEP